MSESTKIPIYKITLPITGSEAILNVCGDFHYGVRGVNACDIEDALNSVAEKYKGNIFRIFTGDNIENGLKTSVGHNYDVAISDPAIQKNEMTQILINTNKKLYGESNWDKLKLKSNTKYNDIRSIGVEGNHEYRTRKQSGQWLGKEMYDQSKTLYAGMSGIIELTLVNKRLKNVKNI